MFFDILDCKKWFWFALVTVSEQNFSVEKLATTVFKLANMSKDADNIVKGCRKWENNTMNNEVEIETIDNNLREARKIGSYCIVRRGMKR